MKVVSAGIKNGVIEDKYGKHGDHFNQNGVPTWSLPFEILDAPEHAKSFAVLLEDKDAYPVSGGFSWVHWLAANITRRKIIITKKPNIQPPSHKLFHQQSACRFCNV